MTPIRKSAAEAGPIKVAGKTVTPGARRRIELPVSRLATGDWMSLSIEVLNGSKPGPSLWLSGAIHGDEVVGVAIIQRVLESIDAATLAGQVIAVPIVNVFGFVAESRYLPDRRDLNRVFPGRSRGSLASRLAHLFMKEVVARCDYGIDLHAGSDNRVNHPQIRANLDDDETSRIAHAFGAPIIIHAGAPKGSLRQVACRRGKRVLVYEGGEPHRFNPDAVEAGALGVLRVMKTLGMGTRVANNRRKVLSSSSTRWVRASRGGIFWLEVEGGKRVREGYKLGKITDPYGGERSIVKASRTGVVIGHTANPLVNRGDALVHIAEI
jgi:predicted deacylase